MLKVTLISHTPQPEKVIAAAAKLCYSSASIEQISARLTDESTEKFINMLSEIGHESPIEHVSFTFGIEGVSRALLAQLTRHRIASYSVQSQRYVSEAAFDFIVPPQISACKEASEEFSLAMQQAQQHYNSLADILKARHKKELLGQGHDEKSAERLAEKKAIEDARFVLPNACETKIVCTFNARSLKNFFRHRCCNRAQWEIRALATEMLRLVIDVAPNLFGSAGPACLSGKCPEGKMTCGKISEVREFFSKMKETL